MASSKKPTYKVEMKLKPERKRRKSDLVIMWQSICGVTLIIVKELWITLIRMWELFLLWFSSSERFQVQTWLEKYLPYVPEDFSESWRDGRLLALLLNKLHPGCFPDATRLDPDYGLKNVYRVFDALEMYFGIKPNVSVEEIVTCSDGSDAKLFAVLLELKNLSDSQPEDEREFEPVEVIEPSGPSPSCVAKGTGLAIGFVGRTTNFIIFCAAISELDVLVEIRGPNSICSERITKRSPKKKRSVSSWEYARHLTRSESLNRDGNNSLVTEEDENFEKSIIPLEYEVMRNQINLGYKPREKGKHRVTILWHGRHVSDSPYSVAVEDPFEVVETNHVTYLKPALKATNEDDKYGSRKISSVRFQEEPQGNYSTNLRDRPSGKILNRKILRYVVRIHGKEIPVNADSTESLATELLKMDYGFETCPLFHRRNSWGFTGDAERKKSVIRQFGIDLKELEAQISQRRSRSLSVNPASRKSLQKSDSFDNLPLRLDSLSEDVFENSKDHENEEDYAYIDEDVSVTDKLNSNDDSEMQHRKNSEDEIETISLSSELTESKFDESLKENSNCEIEVDTISSLSAYTTEVQRADSSKEDLQQNILPCSLLLRSNQLSVDETDRTSVSYQYSNKELHNDDADQRENAPKNYEQTSLNNKIIEKSSKMKNYQKKKRNTSYPGKIHRKLQKPVIKTFYRRVYKNNNSLSSLPTTIFRKRQGSNELMLDTKGNIVDILKNLRIKDSEKSDKPESELERAEAITDEKNFPVEGSHISRNLALQFTNNENNMSYPEEQYIKTYEQNKKVAIDQSFKAKTDEVEMKNICQSEDIVQEPKIKKMVLNHSLNNMLKCLPGSKMEIKDANISMPKQLQIPALKPVRQFVSNYSLNEFSSDVKTKDDNVEKCKPLRTHTLKTLGQFNFKQFDPPFAPQSSISPIKIQIGHWESSLSPQNQHVSAQKLCTYDTEQVSFKEKLAFWENAYKKEERSSPNKSLENKRKRFAQSNSDSLRNDLQNLHSTGKNSNAQLSTTEENRKTSVNQETSVATGKQIDAKVTPELQVAPHKIHRRSFSDPAVSDSIAEKADDFVGFPNLKSSREEDSSSSSTDDNLEQYESDDSEDSGGDYRLISTEDEYIDDEISERASEYWGDLSIVKGWNVSQYTTDYSVLGEEFLQNYCQRDKSHPEECKVFGIAVYYGYVAVKNRFRVYTGDAGFGNLSVSMQGFRQHEVSLVSIAYIRNDVYEVTYQVMTAGYYLISIRWMDKEIPGSPFVCKITF